MLKYISISVMLAVIASLVLLNFFRSTHPMAKPILANLQPRESIQVSTKELLPKYSQFNETLPGLMSTTVQSRDQIYSLILYPTNFKLLNEHSSTTFPCEDYVKGYKGGLSMFLFPSNAQIKRDSEGIPISVYDTGISPEIRAVYQESLGEFELFESTEQYGFVGQLRPASLVPLIDLNGYVVRVSCSDSRFYGYVLNAGTGHMQKVLFNSKDGTVLDYVTIPSGTGIPQRDTQGNIIGDKASSSNSSKRIKTRYKFNADKLVYEEVESWLQ